MSKRAERTTTSEILEKYRNSFWFSFTGTFRVLYHLSVSKNPEQLAKTVDAPRRLVADEPATTTRRKWSQTSTGPTN